MPTRSSPACSTVRRPTTLCARGSSTRRKAIRCSSRRWSRCSANSPGGDVVVPPTIQALLAARLDQLDPAERVVLERGAVEGRVFHRGAVQALSPLQTQLVTPLTALVRRELLRPDRARLPGRGCVPVPPSADPRRGVRRAAEGDAGRPARAVRRLDRRARGRPRRAGRDRRLPPRARLPLPARARPGGRAVAASWPRVPPSGWPPPGSKAAARGDVRAATSLLTRAVALYPAADPRRLVLLPALGRALHEAGHWDRATEVLSEAIRLAQEAGERRIAADASVALTQLRLFTRCVDQPRTDPRRARGRRSLCSRSSATRPGSPGRSASPASSGSGPATPSAAIEDLERAADYARAAGDRLQESTEPQLRDDRLAPRPDAGRRCVEARRGAARPGRRRQPARGDDPALRVPARGDAGELRRRARASSRRAGARRRARSAGAGDRREVGGGRGRAARRATRRGRAAHQGRERRARGRWEISATG